MNLITHFTSLNTFLQKIFEDFSFNFCPIMQTNDPYENTKRFIMLMSRIKQNDPSRLPLCDKIFKQRIKVGSFVKEEGTIDKLDSLTSIKNAPLWSHYANNGEGVALIFDKSALIEKCKKKIDYSWALHNDAVEYTESLNTDELAFLIDEDEISDKSDDGYAYYCFNKAKRLCFKKHILWSYENEYRILLYSKEIDHFKVEIQDCLKSVVFGVNVSSKIRDIISTHFQEIDINTFYVEFNEENNNYLLYQNKIA